MATKFVTLRHPGLRADGSSRPDAPPTRDASIPVPLRAVLSRRTRSTS